MFFIKSPLADGALPHPYPRPSRNTLLVAEMKAERATAQPKPELPGVPEGRTRRTTAGRSRGLEMLPRASAPRKTSGHEGAYRARLELPGSASSSQMGFPATFSSSGTSSRYGKRTACRSARAGSGAGSLVAYALRITGSRSDPVQPPSSRRFLNPERVSMPGLRRRLLHGQARARRVRARSTARARSVDRDVRGAQGEERHRGRRRARHPPIEGGHAQRRRPDPNKIPRDGTIGEPRARAEAEGPLRDRPGSREVRSVAPELEASRHAGMHAAGIVISEGRSGITSPSSRRRGRVRHPVLQDDVEQAGLVKFDFLGLKTLTVIDIAQRASTIKRPTVRATRSTSRTSPTTGRRYQLALRRAGETKGVFQLESSGIRSSSSGPEADAFEDIVAASRSIARPARRRHGRRLRRLQARSSQAHREDARHPLVDHLLVPTYGVIVHQGAGHADRAGARGLLARRRRPPPRDGQEESLRRWPNRRASSSRARSERRHGRRRRPHLQAAPVLRRVAASNKSHSAAYALIASDRLPEAALPRRTALRIATSDKEGRQRSSARSPTRARWASPVLPPDVNEAISTSKVVYQPRRRQTHLHAAPCAVKVQVPQDHFGLGAVRGDARARGAPRAQEGGPSFDLRFRLARRRQKRINKGVFGALDYVQLFDSARRARDHARTWSRRSDHLERSRAASRRPVSAARRTSSGLRRRARRRRAAGGAVRRRYVRSEPWDRREMLAREQKASASRLRPSARSRWLRGTGGLGKLDAVPIK